MQELAQLHKSYQKKKKKKVTPNIKLNRDRLAVFPPRLGIVMFVLPTLHHPTENPTVQ